MLDRFSKDREPVRLTLVEPIVVEVSADVAWSGRAFRHPLRVLRVRPELDPNEVQVPAISPSIDPSGHNAGRGNLGLQGKSAARSGAGCAATACPFNTSQDREYHEEKAHTPAQRTRQIMPPRNDIEDSSQGIHSSAAGAPRLGHRIREIRQQLHHRHPTLARYQVTDAHAASHPPSGRPL